MSILLSVGLARSFDMILGEIKRTDQIARPPAFRLRGRGFVLGGLLVCNKDAFGALGEDVFLVTRIKIGNLESVGRLIRQNVALRYKEL